MDYSFHCYNTLAKTGICLALDKMLINQQKAPVILCVGSDLAIGDSLGPMAGTMIKNKLSAQNTYVYGTLKTPITAKETKYLQDFFRKTHPDRKIIAIDAALGYENEVGLIKISDEPLRPGAGANKRLGKIGDVCILGIVSKKSNFSYGAFNLMRLSAVYQMADRISSAVVNYLNGAQRNEKLRRSV